jgi:hypothetical protein
MCIHHGYILLLPNPIFHARAKHIEIDSILSEKEFQGSICRFDQFLARIIWLLALQRYYLPWSSRNLWAILNCTKANLGFREAVKAVQILIFSQNGKFY